MPLTIAHRSPGFTYGFYPFQTLGHDAKGGGALPRGTLEATLDVWDTRNNHLVPRSVDPNTQYDQRDDLYYAGMIPLNALAGRGDAAFGNMTEFLGTEQEATGYAMSSAPSLGCHMSFEWIQFFNFFQLSFEVFSGCSNAVLLTR